MTRIKSKRRQAKMHTEKGMNGLRFISGCPECPWNFSSHRKQNEPVHVGVQGDSKKAGCAAGHQWKCAA